MTENRNRILNGLFCFVCGGELRGFARKYCSSGCTNSVKAAKDRVKRKQHKLKKKQ